jgi:hypothetical protein
VSVGVGVGVEPCAAAGLVNASNVIVRITGKIRLSMINVVKFNNVPRFKFAEAVGMDFQDIAGRLGRGVKRSPGFCQDRIDHQVVGVDPDHGQVGPDEHHMDGRINTAVMALNQQKTFVPAHAASESIPDELAQERLAPFYPDGFYRRIASVT